jgi:hypothetical protein
MALHVAVVMPFPHIPGTKSYEISCGVVVGLERMEADGSDQRAGGALSNGEPYDSLRDGSFRVPDVLGELKLCWEVPARLFIDGREIEVRGPTR